ncbi:ABC-F family ATP-binding cassette domain-containing protein [Winkia neuii]|uniref:ABC-F family ATP-binding cassette domain-containing protein n=1 Tax=Winkia neuii TaxID=33007 RepID=UPI003D160E0C
MVVTHDRWFLDAVCSYIWEVVPGVDPGYGKPQIPGHVEIYEGSYAAYILAREERAHSAQVAAEKRQNALRKELAWLRRGAPARTSKPKFRIEAAEALIANVPPPRDKVELVSMATSRLGKRVIDLEDVSFAYPDSEPIIKDVTWRLAPGERVGIVGVNGAGKTTLLRLLRGELEPTSGHIRRGKTVQLATLSQATHELDALAERRVVEAVADVKQSIQVAGKEVTATQLVERLGFTRERAWTRIAEISGGERRRLQLMRLLMAEPNVLLLDEPTNDLDTDTLAQMEDLLDSFPGTLVVVSHDRYLLERATDHQMALLPSGALADLPGGVEQYLAMREGQVEKQAPAPKKQNTDAAAQYAARKQARSLERKLDKSRAQIAKVEQEMAALSASLSPQDVAKLAELNKKLQQMQAGQDQLEEEWLEAAEKAEGN